MTVRATVRLVVPDEAWTRAGVIAERCAARLGRPVQMAQVSNALAKLWRAGVVERRPAPTRVPTYEYRRAS